MQRLKIGQYQFELANTYWQFIFHGVQMSSWLDFILRR